MSRRRSQTQKENRERTVNNRRQLDMVRETDTSFAMECMPIVKTTTLDTKFAKNAAGEERLKQLQRWKERKALQHEKEKRERERKGVFKTGLYHPKDTPLPPVPGKVKETKVMSAQTTRVTRSMKQQQVQKDLNVAEKKVQPAVERTNKNRGPVPKPTVFAPMSKTKVEPVTRSLSTRSANKPLVTAVPVVKGKPKDKCSGVRTTRSKAADNKVPPSFVKEKNCQVKPPIPEESITGPESKNQELEQKPCPSSPTRHSEMEGKPLAQTMADSAPVEHTPKSSSTTSFAPEGFVFQAPVGVSSFKFLPLTPRSAEAFLTPSPTMTLSSASIVLYSPQAQPTVADTLTEVSLESKHDVPYFRSEIDKETDRLTSLCVCWESKVEDESIPEEMRDCMRTAVGQARLLMKERFKQFSGLVDDCEFGRGKKITTCTDLQGFWEMVYFQVEDVHKKFDALKEAEARSWVEVYKPPPRLKKVKKPAAAPAKPTATKVEAKSRLAAAKAALKARQQAAESEKAAQAAGTTENISQSCQDAAAQAPLEAQMPDIVVFNGGFFRVESPSKLPGSLRNSSRLSAAALTQPSPSNHVSPRRVTRRSFALAQTPRQKNSNPEPTTTPAHPCLVNKTPAQAPKCQPATPQLSKGTVDVSLRFSPVKEVPSENTGPTELGNTIPSISVVEEKDKPVDTPSSDLNQSLHLSQSTCKSCPTSPMPVTSVCSSFSLSPCKAQLSSPGMRCTPRAVQNLPTQVSVGATLEDSINEEVPGLDFERYLQPLQRESLLPRELHAMEMSPMAVEMESPRGQSEDALTQQEAASILPAVQTLFTHSPQTAESALLLFTPDLKERIRQSVCPTDLMVFTPPNL